MFVDQTLKEFVQEINARTSDPKFILSVDLPIFTSKYIKNS